jgi:hypothetical protein
MPMLPGLYLIYCIENQRFYIGESYNVTIRLGQHYRELKGQTAPCVQLLADWRRFGLEKFLFLVLDAGPQWATAALRKTKETEIINLNSSRVYNQVDARSTVRGNRELPVINNETLYRSVAEASRQTGISATQLRRYLTNPDNTSWVYANTEGKPIGFPSAGPVSVNGIVYSSQLRAAISTGIDRRVLKRLLDNGSNPNILWARDIDSLDES